jgi:hypothetical protein
MVESMRRVVSEGAAAYAASPRREWVLRWPGQVVLCASAVYWTQVGCGGDCCCGVENCSKRPPQTNTHTLARMNPPTHPQDVGEAIAAGAADAAALPSCAERCGAQLLEVVGLVRGELSPLDRCALLTAMQTMPAWLCVRRKRGPSGFGTLVALEP